MTIGEALASVQNRTVSSRDAEVLLSSILDCERAFLYSHAEHELTQDQITRYEEALHRREQNEPVAYITGKKEFYGRVFHCDSRALIPRPETEALIDEVVQWLNRHTSTEPLNLLELGTGSGNIAVTIATEKTPSLQIIATDISPEALELARKNYSSLQQADSSPINFVVADLFDHPDIFGKKFDCIVANLPYVSDTWKVDPRAQADVVFYEPDLALFGGDDGLNLYRRFFSDVQTFIKPHGFIAVEYGETQTGILVELIKKSLPNWDFRIEKDYAGLDRAAFIWPK